VGPRSETRVLALHELRLKGFVPVEMVGDTVGTGARDVAAQLQVLVAEGLVQHRDGRMSGFSLTAAGRAEHRRALAAELDAHGMRAAVDRCYRRFLAHNREVLELCTAWQVRDVDGRSVANEHDDPAYDRHIIDSLGRVDDQVQPVCVELGEALGRFARYGPGLRHARERVEAGDGSYFTAPALPSYHSLWFELHEDLLATLGLERTAAT
jgi:hypothetical protein